MGGRLVTRRMWFALALAAACIGPALLAQNTPADTLVIPVTGSVTEGDRTYSFAGNITFTRPAPTIQVLPGPAFCGLHDLAGTYLRVPIPGTEVVAHGRDFGTAKGRVFWGAEEVAVSEWTDTTIRFRLPTTPINSRGHLLVIHRPDGAGLASSVAMGG